MNTTIAVLADIHGNLPGLEAVLHDMQMFQPAGFIVAGDLTSGPQPNQVIQLLRQLGRWLILGNSDINLLRYVDGSAPESWSTLHQFASLRWANKTIDPEILRYLQGLPEQSVVQIPGTAPIRVVHGSPRDPYESILLQEGLGLLETSLAMIEEPVLVCGHTHQPWAMHLNGKLALNPGSVAGPLNGQVGAQYALLRWLDGAWEAELHMVSYDLRRIRSAFVESGLLAEGGPLMRCFLLSIETGTNVARQFLDYAYRLAGEAGYAGSQVVPDEIWDKAAECFDWSLNSLELP